jgi:hypothetical protein
VRARWVKREASLKSLESNSDANGFSHKGRLQGVSQELTLQCANEPMQPDEQNCEGAGSHQGKSRAPTMVLEPKTSIL